MAKWNWQSLTLENGDSANALVSVAVVKVESKKDCLLIPEVHPQILMKVFSYLPKNDLLNARRVSKTWNGVVTKFFCSLFPLQLKTIHGDSNNLVEFTKIAPKSMFCAALSNFQLSIKTHSEIRLDDF